MNWLSYNNLIISILFLFLTTVFTFSNFSLADQIQKEFNLILLIIFLFLTFFEFKTKNDKLTPFSYKQKPWWFFVLIFGFLVLGISTNSIWLDEYNQLMIYTAKKFKIVHHAMFETQPPLNYIFGAFIFEVFGNGHLTARLSSIIPVTISFLLIFDLLEKLKVRREIIFLCLSLLILNKTIVIYSLEARPFAFSLFFFALYLQNFIETQESENIYQFLKLGIIGALFLYSIGLQPPIIILTVLVSSATTQFRVSKKRSSWYLLSGIISLILYLPYTITLTNHFKIVQADRFKGLSINRLIEGLKSFNLNELIEHSNNTNTLLPIMIILLSISFILIRKKGNITSFAKRSLILSGIFIMPIFLIIYNALITWHLSERYLYLIIFIIYIGFAIVLEEVLKLINVPRKITLYTIPVIIISIFTYSTLNTELFKKHGQIDWRTTYNFLQKYPHEAEVFVINTSPLNSWFPYKLIGLEIYNVNNKKLIINQPTFTNELNSTPLMTIKKAFEQRPNASREIILIQASTWNNGFKISDIVLSNTITQELDGISMLILKDKNNIENQLYALFEKIVTKNNESNINFRFYETLILLDCLRERPLKYLSTYKELPVFQIRQYKLKKYCSLI